MPDLFRKYLFGIAALVFPEICRGCGEWPGAGRTGLCRRCESEMPRTWFEKVPGNPVEQMFWGRAKIEFATSLFFTAKVKCFSKLSISLNTKETKMPVFIWDDWLVAFC
ncbi:hypothetical protein [Marinilabilia salmonicolor]|uniref:hypothetical protein n=1 Tax=Marinilabilia salmonicolor TaxID=989 RepID=UPI001F3D452B|nr:hypothetical protein [Marinilabilia salmonicolor]